MRRYHIIIALLTLIIISACKQTPTGKATEQNYRDCQDKDGGIIYDNAASVYGTATDGSDYELRDSCTSTNTVKEWHCEQTRPVFINYNCRNMGDYSCKEGKCQR